MKYKGCPQLSMNRIQGPLGSHLYMGDTLQSIHGGHTVVASGFSVFVGSSDSIRTKVGVPVDWKGVVA